MSGPRIGSLFSGAGGLELGVMAALGGEVVWHSEVDRHACRVLAKHWPGVPNLGDITAIDWATVPPVDILTGGFPCQDLSLAGRRAGLAGARSGLWSHMAEGIDVLRPGLVIIENVKGIRSAKAHASRLGSCPGCVGGGAVPALRALGAVVGDLADFGYDTVWDSFRAADAGAAHQRERVFVLAYPHGKRIDWPVRLPAGRH